MSIYSKFTRDDIVEANPTVVTTGLWSDDTGSLEGPIYVNNTQLTNSKEYYFDVYSKDSTNPLSEVQYAISYGHINGGGAPTLEVNNQATLPTKAIYSQYRNLLLDPSDAKFSFQGVESDHIYVINFQRSRIRQQLDPGNWELPLSGTRGIITFIDDSGQTLGALTANSKAGRVFNIVSGSIRGGTIASASTNGTTWGVNGPGYGLVYPDLGIIVLNPNAICPAVGFYTSQSNDVNLTGSVAAPTVSSSITFYNASNLKTTLESVTSQPYAPVTRSLSESGWGATLSTYNHAALFIAINKAINSDYDRGFQARSAETISSTHYFVRLRNKEFNYSNNPTFYNVDNGSLVQSEFRNDPKVYITTIGLYNDQNELLAVAKLSKPVRKSFAEEVLCRVRLDF